MKALKVIGGIFAGLFAIAVLIGIAFAMELGGLQWDKFFAPKHEAVRREVYENTESYTRGMAQQLSKYRYEYVTAKTPEDKKAIAAVVRSTFANYDRNLLPVDLATFLDSLDY